MIDRIGNIGGIFVGLLIALAAAVLIYMARTSRPRSWRNLDGDWRPPSGNIRNAKQAIRAGTVIFVVCLIYTAVVLSKLLS